MSPNNVALVKLFEAEKSLRDAQARLDGASQSVRVQERRIKDLTEKQQVLQSQLREQQSKAGQLDLDIKTREAQIERLRTQQQTAKNHKEYQTFLTEINTHKIDKNKVEDQYLQVMEVVEDQQKQLAELAAQLETEQKKHQETRQQLSGRLDQLQADIDRLRPVRDEAAHGIPPKSLDMFERLSERYDGEAMSAIAKPNRRVEEYVCSACNMSLVTDIYNRLHVRDEPVICPNCRRMLYIPDDLPPEMALNTRPKKAPAPVPAEQ